MGSFTDVKQYDQDFFSGTQAQLFFGDVLIDDAVRIQWTYTKKPRVIYSCNSVYFDAVVVGERIVEGLFSINFKERAYIPIILEYLKKRKQAPVLGKGSGYTNKTSDNEIGLDIERHLQYSSSKDQLQGEEYLLSKLHWTNDQKFEDWAEALEDKLWKGSSSTGNEILDTVSLLDSPLIPIPFDIYTLYGDYSKTTGNDVNHTAIKLENCVIIGESQIVEIGGQPIAETYNFIGRKKV